MKILLNCFEGEYIHYKKDYENATTDLISQLSKDLNVELLESFIVPNDFGKELTEFQLLNGLTVEYTNDDTGRAFGKTLSYVNNGKHCITVFIDKSILFHAFSDNSETSKLAIHLIHHELCHVHDDIIRARLFGVDYIMKERGDFNEVLKIHANAIWAEFIATKLSISSIYVGYDMNIGYLFQIIDLEKDKCEQYIDEYRVSNDIDTLLNRIELSSFYVLRLACIVYGNLIGISEILDENSYEEMKKSIDDKIAETYIKDIWIELGRILSVMNNEYPDWNGEVHIENLSKIVLMTWNEMGIFPLETEEGIYIEVPYQ